MMLSSGTRLGAYEIQSPLGAGGMGEVYKARDTRLDRTVAIKVLPAHVASDQDLRQRFEREARAVAALNHPHICTLHDIGSQDGIDYLVMEYLEGGTLADKLAKGSLPLDQALRYGIEIADALDKAHRAGIVHRDLKPSNIMLTKSGAKLLDFGLAKTGTSVVSGAGLSMLPTIDANLTAQGTILGTLQYMAPEQLEGYEADSRTDIFAFGAVLYELLTGKKAFDGKSHASLISAILKDEPPPASQVQPIVPRLLDRAIKRCLAKDRDERWQSAKDLHEELKWIANAADDATVARLSTGWRPTRRRLAWTAAGTVVIAALVGFRAYSTLQPPPARQAMRLHVLAPENTAFTLMQPANAGGRGGGAISPDGTQLAFVATDASGETLLWLRPLDAFSARRIAGTSGAACPFWSPDSRFIGFFAGGKLMKIDLAGGTPQTITTMPDIGANSGNGASWNRDGVILFAQTSSPVGDRRLFRISADGGPATPVTMLNKQAGESAHYWPSFLPDGQHFLYLATGAPEAQAIYVGALDGRPPKRLFANTTNAVYAPPGFLLYVRNGTLLAQPFDTSGLEAIGTTTRVADQVGSSVVAGLGSFSVSNTETLTYFSATSTATQFTWFDRSGRALDTVGPPGSYATPHLSPDERRVALSKLDEEPPNIWMLDLAQQTLSRFTTGGTSNGAWSSDGSMVYFSRAGQGVFAKPAAGGLGGVERRVSQFVAGNLFQVAPDGDSVLYSAGDIFALPLAADSKPLPLVQTPFLDTDPQWSPDGRWLAYQSNQTGRAEVYVEPVPASGARWRVSRTGGRQPMWRRDGRELFFVNDAANLYAVEVRPGVATFEFSTPQLLFNLPATVIARNHSYTPSRDGQRFLVDRRVDASGSPINVVINWTAELKK